jgi:hypothetical protein
LPGIDFRRQNHLGSGERLGNDDHSLINVVNLLNFPYDSIVSIMRAESGERAIDAVVP